MAPKSELHSTTEVTELQQALQTATFELNYERSSRIVEGVAKDEDIRKLKFQILLLEDENEELHEQLMQEEDRADGLERDVDEAEARSEELQAELQRVSNELRAKAREIDILKAELLSLQTVSTDSAKLLTEKLALARKLSVLEPELEHLRSQSSSNQSLLTEKLSLQRQVHTLQVELENEKRAVQRALAKGGRISEQDAEHQAQLEELRNGLSKEKREREKVEKILQKAQTELEDEKRATRQLSTKQDEKGAKQEARVENLRSELSKEKREREKAEKAAQKSQLEWEAQKSVLDDKLNAFRTKLKSTKDKLKETEVELSKAQAAAAARPASKDTADKPNKNPRKRGAAQADPDATIGTPGGGLPAKRGKRASAMPGDKSTFSITPFLNRTASLAPESPAADAEAAQKDDDNPTAGVDAPPSAAAEKPSKEPKPLAPSTANKLPAKPAARKKAALPTLEKVAEEEDNESSHEQENAFPSSETAIASTASAAMVPKPKPASHLHPPRKSLASFATFTAEPPAELKQRKKRKLLGGAGGLGGKTLFDEDEGGVPAKPIPGRGLFAARALAKPGGLGAGKGTLMKGGAALLTTEDGFQFSPLKRDRRAKVVTGAG